MHKSIYNTMKLGVILFIFSLCTCANDAKINKIELELGSEQVINFEKTEIMLSVSCDGDWKLSTIYETTGEDWCALSKISGSGSQTIPIYIGANEWQRSREVKLQLKSGSSTKTTIITQGWWKEYKADEPQKVEKMTERPTWLELPALTEYENSALVSHNTYIDNCSERNFTMLYDTVNRIAHWVAYPMHLIYIGTQSRTDYWGYDPKVPYAYQPKLTSSFPDSNYDRGHIVASAMRTANYQTNAQTFYYTNMTAQESYLNRYYVSGLESKIRDWAEGVDSLFATTGVKLSGDKTLDVAGNEVAVPSHYYYVLLAFEGTATRSIGFWFENVKLTTSDNPLSGYAKSVKEIETLTGFEFFANLEGSSAKADYSLSDWF